MNRPSSAHPWLVPFWRAPSWLALLVLVVDQATKLAVVRAWPPTAGDPPVTVIPRFFSLVHYRNTGAAWSLLSGQTTLLALVSIVVVVAAVVYFRNLAEGWPERALALGVVLGGVLGNLLDRVFRKSVVDFLLFYWGDWRRYAFPAFNVADSAITCGVAVYILSCFLRGEADSGTDGECLANGDG